MSKDLPSRVAKFESHFTFPLRLGEDQSITIGIMMFSSIRQSLLIKKRHGRKAILISLIRRSSLQRRGTV